MENSTVQTRIIAFVVGLALTLAAAGADQVTFQASKDNTLIQVDFGGPMSNGIGPRFFTGRNSIGNPRRGLLAFNLAAIPPGSTVTGVTLTLYMSKTQTGVQPVSLHRALADWGEGTSFAGGVGGGTGQMATPGDATWEHRFYPDVFWANAGGDFAPGASATTNVNAVGTYLWTSAAMVADVQGWVNAPAGNFGWVVVSNEAEVQTAKRFESREGQAGRRPALTVTFTPPSGALGGCCIGGACQLLTAAQCATMGGVYQGDGAPCSPDPCAPPSGACCLPDGACEELTASACAGAGGVYRGDGVACGAGVCDPVLAPFVDALPIPAVATPVTGVPGGAAHYEIAMTEFTQQLHRDLPPTRVWGYGGAYPGPTILAQRDEPVTVTWVNDLRDAQGVLRQEHALHIDHCLHGTEHAGSEARTVVHLHGGHVDAVSDGHPEETFGPGEQSELYHYPNTQPGATLWYHDHALGITRLNVYMGLAGAYVIRDPAEAALGLPAGEFDLPLIIQDRSLNLDGSLRYPEMWHEHFFGDFNLVNGKVAPYMDVKRGKYRFRIVNGANSRTYTLALSSGAAFHQIGSDGGLLAAPVAMSSLTISPGERADVVIDFAGLAAGTEVVLTNSAPAPFPGPAGEGVVPDVMKFIVGEEAGHTAEIPGVLAAISPIPMEAVAVTRTLVLRKYTEACAGAYWLIGGLMWDDITDLVRLGSTEVWSFANRSGTVHPMHMHLVQFQVLDRQAFEVVDEQIVLLGAPMPPDLNETGWKDTVQVRPFEITRVIARFERFPGLFSYHCHILEHEDHEMMRQFRATCAADWNVDLSVNSSDISAFLTGWLASVTAPNQVADFNNDGLTNSSDISAFLTAWISTVTGGCEG